MYEYNAKVINVVDGDTLDLVVELGFDVRFQIRVRLNGIDTPETRTRNLLEKAHGLKAKEFVINKTLGKDVFVKTSKDKKGKYGRYLADIFYKDDLNVGLEVVHSLVEELITFGFEKRYDYLY